MRKTIYEGRECGSWREFKFKRAMAGLNSEIVYGDRGKMRSVGVYLLDGVNVLHVCQYYPTRVREMGNSAYSVGRDPTGITVTLVGEENKINDIEKIILDTMK